jgi:chemotaxis response regulator CheB
MACIRVNTRDTKINLSGYVSDGRPVVALSVANGNGDLVMSIEDASSLIEGLPAAIEEAKKTHSHCK